MNREDFIKQLEADGPEAVRLRLSRGLYVGSRAVWAANWLGPKDEESQRQALQITEGALNQARRANIIAGISMAISALALLVSLFTQG